MSYEEFAETAMRWRGPLQEPAPRAAAGARLVSSRFNWHLAFGELAARSRPRSALLRRRGNEARALLHKAEEPQDRFGLAGHHSAAFHRSATGSPGERNQRCGIRAWGDVGNK